MGWRRAACPLEFAPVRHVSPRSCLGSAVGEKKKKKNEPSAKSQQRVPPYRRKSTPAIIRSDASRRCVRTSIRAQGLARDASPSLPDEGARRARRPLRGRAAVWSPRTSSPTAGHPGTTTQPAGAMRQGRRKGGWRRAKPQLEALTSRPVGRRQGRQQPAPAIVKLYSCDRSSFSPEDTWFRTSCSTSD